MSVCSPRWRFIVFATVSFSRRAAAVLVAALAIAGVGLSPLRESVRKAGAGEPRLAAARLIDVAIPGVLRALVADGLWLKVYVAWAGRDRPRTERLIRLVSMVDDRPLEYWINGARIIASDIAEWRLSSDEASAVPAEVRRQIVEEQAQAAVGHLAEAEARHPDKAAIWVEMGNIQLYRRRDLARAAECYRRAAESPDAPFFATRIYAELLQRLGRDHEAYAWLCRVHPTLPANDQAAMSGLVLRRIRELEKRLDLSPQEQYMPDLDPLFRANVQDKLTKGAGLLIH
jgi:tetratricopeptide (TPR) repeat protein